ncbi:T9SS type A sorting domain-containing protein [Brumimicrobium aurantiacum]|nr:T9SS type A sorting domain-containing protein [Brumimicrobium aurantiacum]
MAEVILTIEDPNGCLQYDTIQLTTVQVPYTNIWSGGPNIYCDNIPSGSTFQWYLDGAIIPGAVGQVYTPVVNGVYSLVVTNGICSYTTDNYHYYKVGLTDVNKNEISLTPNPATSKIKINTLNLKFSFTIYDATGKVVMEAEDVYDNTIPIIDLVKGIYMIELLIGEDFIMKRFVKN